MDEFTKKRADKLLRQGLEEVGRGEIRSALDKFRASASAVATADSLTYWGWMEHQSGDTEMAISLCHQAISLDPEFGNPYNDIGSYLVSQGKMDEAIPWFEKAVTATRYEPRQFPHINLGRVFMVKDEPLRALCEFKKALVFAPDDVELKELIQMLQQTVN